ncbi:MAG: IS66 family insertion sequence element accessory protein TnpB [Lachnospiraceae bacterium]|nr:IS66 family insertion sequence element accessory protein TnpB [Lachnospiraceae bacterium]
MLTIYLFCGKRCDRIKILMKEPDGFVLIYSKREVIKAFCVKSLK